MTPDRASFQRHRQRERRNVHEGIVRDLIDPDVVVKSETAKSGYTGPNAYLDKSGGKYAKNVANPLNASFMFVIAMLVGAAMWARKRRRCPPSV